LFGPTFFLEFIFIRALAEIVFGLFSIWPIADNHGENHDLLNVPLGFDRFTHLCLLPMWDEQKG
jgi:hypothetical protein